MKKYFYLATALVALAACSSNDYVGDQEALNSAGQVPISFSGGTPSMTRATEGAPAATLLNNNFVLFGYKTVSGATQTVFDNYQANFIGISTYTTNSNSAGWEYVSYKNLPYGTKTTSDGELNTDGVATNATASGIEQSVKYWDTNASKYNFFAYSLGKGTESPTTYAKASALTNRTTPTYTLEGTAAQLGTCYISRMKEITISANSEREVNLDFIGFSSKIQLKFYEVIAGYSVKDLKFYVDANNKSTGDADNDGLRPALYGADNSIPTGGKYTITFDDNKNPVVTLTSATTADSKVLFDAVSTSPNVWMSGYKGKEFNEEDGSYYIGRVSNDATSTKQMIVLLNSTGATLTLKMDYTLVSRDGSGETIQVEGATATIPAAYTKWNPNYAYTYIFKITDDKLVPITLDAVVTETLDGTQETITTVDDPSITTFGVKSSVYSVGKNEYETGSDIYATFLQGSTVLTPQLTNQYNTNFVKVYSVDYKEGTTDAQKTAYPITELSVANAIEHAGGLITATHIAAATNDYFTTAPAAVTTVPAEDGTTKTIDALKLEGAKKAGKVAVEIVTYKEVTGLTVGTSLVGDYYTLSSGTYTKCEATAVAVESPAGYKEKDKCW